MFAFKLLKPPSYEGYVECSLYPSQRLKGFFSGGEDPLSNVNAGTGLPVRLHKLRTAELCNERLNLCGGERNVPVLEKRFPGEET